MQDVVEMKNGAKKQVQKKMFPVEIITTAIVCLPSDALSGQIIFLNSDFMPFIQFFLGGFFTGN